MKLLKKIIKQLRYKKSEEEIINEINVHNYYKYKSYPVLLTRGTKDSLETKNIIYDEHVLIVEITPEDREKINNNDPAMYNIRGKYRIADGIHHYKDLPYCPGEIPVAFKGDTLPHALKSKEWFEEKYKNKEETNNG